MKGRLPLCLTMLFFAVILSNHAHAAESVAISYSDVPPSHWAYAAITEMTSRGMFNGTSVSANGQAYFSPNSDMTRAQFVAVLTRYLYGDELAQMPAGDTWYANNYMTALRHGLLTSEELTGGDLSASCSRQEMSMLLVRAAYTGSGEVAGLLIPISNIPDYSKVDPYYKTYVLQAYSMGFLGGVDKKGTFNPEGHLTRAQAATVIYRLLDPSARVEIRFEEAASFTWENGTSYVGEIKDGEANGYGKMVFPSIGTYVGYFVNGNREGLGTFTWLQGDSYVGYWSNDKMNGAGTYTFSDGYAIRGIWQNNQISADAIYMSPSSLVTTVGATEQIVALVEPEKITEVIEWTSSGDAVSISGSGNLCTIVAKAAGSAIVTARTASGKTTACAVTVNEKIVLAKQIRLNYGDYTAISGGEFQLTAEVAPSDAANGKITWSTSDSNVASVSVSGAVTAKMPGVAIISAKTESGLIATCYVVVENLHNDSWSGSWNVYEATSAGEKATATICGTCLINAGNMTASLSMQPYTGKYIDLNPEADSVMSGLFETGTYAYELTFTSIHDNLIVMEVKEIMDSDYSGDTIRINYYALER